MISHINIKKRGYRETAMLLGLSGLALVFYFPSWVSFLVLFGASCGSLYLFTSDAFLKWYFKDDYNDSLKSGKSYFNEGKYLDAVIHYSEALTYKRGSSALLGMAAALDKIQETDLAISYYGSAYSCSLFNKEQNERLLDLADFYITSLVKKEDSECDKIALAECVKILQIVENKLPVSYIIQMNQAILLLKTARLSEAQKLFEIISKEAPQQELRGFASEFNTHASKKMGSMVAKYSDAYLADKFTKWIN